MALIKHQYQVTAAFSAIDRVKNVTKDFAVGDKFYGTAATDGTVTTGNYSVATDYVKDLGVTNSILMLAGIGVAFIIIAVLVWKYFSKK